MLLPSPGRLPHGEGGFNAAQGGECLDDNGGRATLAVTLRQG